MGEDLFRLIATGLLAVIVLLLLLALSQLGRLRRSISERAEATPASDTDTSQVDEVPSVAASSDESPVSEPVAEEPHADATGLPDSAVVSTGAPLAEASPEPAAETTETVTEEDEEGPYEQDGRWWFRRGAELLVYDEQLEQWVDSSAESEEPAATPAMDAEPVAATPEPVTQAQPVAEPEPHPLDEAREWKPEQTETAPVPVADVPVAEPTPVATTEVTSPAAISEPVNAPAPIADETGSQEQPASGGHWKCPSCGVINGSTASSCRMCFGARP
jgi:hypothetical protein